MGKLMAKLVRALKTRPAAAPSKPLALPEPARRSPPRELMRPAPARPVLHETPRRGAGLFALDALQRAWRKVKANGGGAGVDGETLKAFETDLRANLRELQTLLQTGKYEPQPVRRVWVPKASGGLRPLAILTIRDRIAQRVVYDALAPQYEKKFLDCSYGFREGRSLHDAVETIIQARDAGRHWVVDGDIKDCFERLDHRLLLQMVREEVRDATSLSLIERWLKAQVFNELDGRRGNTGTFQGGVISPLLANIYLHRFDEELTRAGLFLVRYADDWVILCNRKTQAEAALARATQVLDRLRLAINPYKTRIVNFDEGFAFLGVFFVRDEFFYLSPAIENKQGVSRGNHIRS